MKNKLGIVYAATILFSLHYFLTTYISSSFLVQYFSNAQVGILFAVGSVITIVAFLTINPLLQKIGNNRLFLWCAIIELGTLIAMSFSTNPYIIGSVFILRHALIPLFFLSFDIYLEHWSEPSKTGSVRGLFLMIFNACAPIAAYASGSLIASPTVANTAAHSMFMIPYLLSAAFMLSLIILNLTFFGDFKDSEYKQIKTSVLARELVRNKKIRSVFVAAFLLQLSYTFMIVYIPLYLSETLGMSLKDATIAIAISLISFVLFQSPLGKFADMYGAERNVVRGGLWIMFFSFLFIPFITVPSLVLWAITLFVLRLGASFVEVGSESYFFKQIDETNSQVIEFWRISHPLAFFVGPLIGAIVLSFTTLPYVFFVAAAMLIAGIVLAKNITYTKTIETF